MNFFLLALETMRAARLSLMEHMAAGTEDQERNQERNQETQEYLGPELRVRNRGGGLFLVEVEISREITCSHPLIGRERSYSELFRVLSRV
jgi:hypothetical protein